MEGPPERLIRRRRAPSIINRWVVLGALLFACVMLTATLGLFSLRGRGNSSSAPSTAVLLIIPAASSTPTGSASGSLPSGGVEQTPPAPPAGEITIGAYVQVAGTGGDGLRMREQPGLNGPVRFVASEAEVFQVAEGPVQVDEYTWWRLVGPFDETRQGWAVANFLEIVQGP